MYCVKTETGKERIRVRSVSSGFLPSYVFANSGSGARRLVVPGYIFSLTRLPRSVQVPEDEWKIIDALSDPHPSRIGPDGKVVSGPLAGLGSCITAVKEDRIQITATLLGEVRVYWIAAERDGGEETEESTKETNPEVSSMEKKRVFTAEEIRKALELQEQIGNRAAAAQLGISWQQLARWKRDATRPGKSENNRASGEDAPVKTKGTSSPEAEIARLRERVAALEAKNEKLRKALAELL
jgi:hypothetical protein